MVFNWFNRFRKKEEEPRPEAETQSKTPESSAQPVADEAPAEPDYERWARLAYENLQRQETESRAAPPEPPVAQPSEPFVFSSQPVIDRAPEPVPFQPPELPRSSPPEIVQPPPPELPRVEPAAPSGDLLSEWGRFLVDLTPPPPAPTVEAPPVPIPREPEPFLPPEPAAPVPEPLPPPEPVVAREPETLALPEPVRSTPEWLPEVAPVEPVVAREPAPSTPDPVPSSAPARQPEPEVPFWKRLLYGTPATPVSPPPDPVAPPAPVPLSPEARTTPPAAPEPQVVPLPLDAGFLWSAEVLAAQGRRPEDVTIEEISWLQKLRVGLGRTRRGLVNNVKAIVGRGPIGKAELEELEEVLLQADVGVSVTERVLGALQERVRKEALPADQVMKFLKSQLREQVELDGDDPTQFAPERGRLNVWLIVGVNGVGKTTTIGKIAALANRSGYRTVIAAGDTFRAAAVEQLQEWGRRADTPVISNPTPNADPAAVVFDAIGAARARNAELLIVDTAGRLQNKKNLMDELAKVRRIIDKQAADAHIESILVLDSTTGQNGLQQAKVFTEVAKLTGVILTKLDGTAKGGIALAIVDALQLPIRFVGVGEKLDDLRPFNSFEFIEALLSDIED